MIKDSFNILMKVKVFLKNSKKVILILVFVNVLTILISVFSPSILSKIISCIISFDYEAIVWLLVGLGVIKIFSLILSILNLKCFYKIRSDFIVSLKSKISASILNYDITTFSLNGKGKMFQRINNDPENIANLMSVLNHYLIYLISNFGVLIFLIYINVYIGLVYIFFTFLVLIIRNVGIMKKIFYKNIILKSQESINDNFSEMLNGFKDIKQLDMKNNFQNINEDSFINLEKMNVKADVSYVIFDKIAYILELFATVIILFLSMFFYKNGTLTISGLLNVFMYKTYVFSFSDNVTNFLLKLSEFNLSCSRVFELISEEDVCLKNKKNMPCRGNIEFRNVYFSYNCEENNVLEECSFKIKENDKILIVGESGSGKTTILNLIAKIYKCSDNQIFIDDVDINTYDENFIRNNITVISQYYYLFDMSIRENFRLVKKNVTQKEIDDVCKKVGIYDFIMSLPNKFDTVIGTGGYNLSGGQRQRIAIARTLLLESKIILFDEITSSLDANLENLIMNLINDLEGKHTIIMVSHNTKLFSSFSKILVLNNGKIEKIGSHKYLLNSSKKYRELYYGKI